MPEVLPFADFVCQLGARLEVGVANLRAANHVVDDLGFDSLDRLEAVLLVEGLSGSTFPDEFADMFHTLGDLYKMYEWACNRDTRAISPWPG